LWIDRKSSFRAGFVAGLLLYKHQLIVGIIFGFLIFREWKFLRGILTAGVAGTLVSLLVLRQETLEYFRFSYEKMGLLTVAPGIPQGQFFDLRGVFKMLFPFMPSGMISLFSLLVAGFFLFLFWRWNQRNPFRGKDSVMTGVVLLIPWCAPYLFLYDWVLLLIPWLLLSKGGEISKEFQMKVTAWIWFVGLISYPVSQGMLKSFGFAIQIAPVVLGWLTYQFFNDECL